MDTTYNSLVKYYISAIIDITGYQAKAIQRNDTEDALMWERYIVRMVTALSSLKEIK